MRQGISVTAVVAIVVLAGGGSFRLKAEATYLKAQAKYQAPSLQKVWTCPMHGEVLETTSGICPICKMDLVPALVEPAWICPIHAAVMTDAPGTCPLDGRELLPVKVGVSWKCPNHPDVSELEPGLCKLDKVPLERTRSLRPHEDHTPKHGGVFFMAPDTWHHLEGTYPEPGLFRVYVYDNYSQPMEVKAVKGRAVLNEVYDEATKTTKEVTVHTLQASADGQYLEARVGDLSLPVEITAKVQFDANRPEDRFDFAFGELSKEPDPNAAASPAPAVGIPAPIIQVVIPEAPDQIAAEIQARDHRVNELMAKGSFLEVWVPALEAKDLGLALDARLDALPEEQRFTVKLAIKQLVRAAWLLDWYADLGDRQQVTAAYDMFSRAVAEIMTAFP